MESEIGGGEEVSRSTRNAKPIVAPRSDHLTVWGNTGAHIELDDESWEKAKMNGKGTRARRSRDTYHLDVETADTLSWR
jgi:hypothetical protein